MRLLSFSKLFNFLFLLLFLISASTILLLFSGTQLEDDVQNFVYDENLKDFVFDKSNCKQNKGQHTCEIRQRIEAWVKLFEVEYESGEND